MLSEQFKRLAGLDFNADELLIERGIMFESKEAFAGPFSSREDAIDHAVSTWGQIKGSVVVSNEDGHYICDGININTGNEFTEDEMKALKAQRISAEEEESMVDDGSDESSEDISMDDGSEEPTIDDAGDEDEPVIQDQDDIDAESSEEVKDDMSDVDAVADVISAIMNGEVGGDDEASDDVEMPSDEELDKVADLDLDSPEHFNDMDPTNLEITDDRDHDPTDWDMAAGMDTDLSKMSSMMSPEEEELVMPGAPNADTKESTKTIMTNINNMLEKGAKVPFMADIKELMAVVDKMAGDVEPEELAEVQWAVAMAIDSSMTGDDSGIGHSISILQRFGVDDAPLNNELKQLTKLTKQHKQELRKNIEFDSTHPVNESEEFSVKRIMEEVDSNVSSEGNGGVQIKVPANIKKSLKKACADHAKQVKYFEDKGKFDIASFHKTVLGALTCLADCLDNDYTYASHFITTLMGDLQREVPADVYRFLTSGGAEEKSLSSYFKEVKVKK